MKNTFSMIRLFLIFLSAAFLLNGCNNEDEPAKETSSIFMGISTESKVWIENNMPEQLLAIVISNLNPCDLTPLQNALSANNPKKLRSRIDVGEVRQWLEDNESYLKETCEKSINESFSTHHGHFEEISTAIKEDSHSYITNYLNLHFWSYENKKTVDSLLNSSSGSVFEINLHALAANSFSSYRKGDLSAFGFFLDYLDINELATKEKDTFITYLYYSAEVEYEQKQYQKAYRNYLLLKGQSHSTSKYNWMFKKADKRLNQLPSKVNKSGFKKRIFSKDKIDIFESGKWLWLWVLIGLFILGISIVLVKWREYVYLNKHESIPGKEPKKVRLESEIVSKDELISEEAFLKQDGRVYRRDIKRVRNKLKKNALFKPGDEIEKYALMLVEGRKMIEKINRYAPCQLSIFRIFADLLGKLNFVKEWFVHTRGFDFWLYNVAGFSFALLWYGLQRCLVSSTGEELKYGLSFIILIGGLIIICLTGVGIISRKIINSLDEIVSMLEKRESLRNMEQWSISLFRSPWHYYISAVLMLIVIFKGEYIKLYTGFEWINCFFIFLLIVMFSQLLLFIFKSISFTNHLCALEDLSIHPLSPIKTLGLQKWISVVGTIAMVSSIVITYAASIPVVMSYVQSGGANSSSFFWLIIFMPLLFFYWFYPYMKLRDLVKLKKMQRMHFLKTKISQAYGDWENLEDYLIESMEKDSIENTDNVRIHMIKERREIFNQIKPELEMMKSYFEMFKEIDKSPNTYVDIHAALELAKVLGLPSLFALLTYLLG